MKAPLVSVIIPAYNVERYINRCVDSIIEQSYKNIEILIIDDGSTDKTSEVCRGYTDKYENIKYFHIENSGVGAARNIGIRNAHGEIMYFVDSDDELYNETINDLVSNLKDCEMAIGSYTNVYKRGIKETILAFKRYSYDEFKRIAMELYKQNALNTVWNKLFRSSIIKNNNIRFKENIHLGEDLLFVLQYLKHCGNIICIDKPIYKYYREHGTLTKTYNKSSVEGYFIQHNAMTEFLDKDFLVEENEFFIKRLTGFLSSSYDGAGG
ncbi:MAG: glycosyltransferase family 2 protein, partial [Candidatus Ornithomonoglobus sp.]